MVCGLVREKWRQQTSKNSINKKVINVLKIFSKIGFVRLKKNHRRYFRFFCFNLFVRRPSFN